MKQRECVICHKKYTPKTGNQKVCSEACRKKYIKKMRPIWNKKHYEKHKNKKKEYNEKNIEKQKTYRKDYYQKNKDRIKQYNKEWREENKDKRKTYQKEWYNTHKTYLKDYRAKRRLDQIDKAFADYYEYLDNQEW